MPSLVCSVQNCVYNNAMYCSKGDIQVGGEEARKCQETCGESFQERKETCVDCKACHCTYNDHCKCTAGKIDIAGAAASTRGETECATFQCKC